MLRQQQEEEQTVGETAGGRGKGSWFRKPTPEPTIIAEKTAEAVPLETDAVRTPPAVLHRIISKRKKILCLPYVGTGILCSGLMVGKLTAMNMEHVNGTMPGFMLAMGLVLAGDTLLVASVFWGLRATQQAVTELANSDDRHAIGPLAEALSLTDPVHSLAVSGLTRLLPQLQPSDRTLLNATQISCLRRALRQSSNRRLFWRYNPHFAAVLQQALATLGELPAIEQPDTMKLASHRPVHVEALLEQFQAAVRLRQKNSTTIGIAAGMAALCSVGNIIAQGLIHAQANTPLLSVAVASIAVTLGFTFRGMFRLNAMMNELADAGDLRVIGPLLDISALQDVTGNTMAVLLLTRLLPRLKASDAGLLTEEQQAALSRTLTRNVNNADYLIAALAALEQIGDGKALPLVESLATGRTMTAEPKRVQVAARACLPYLQTRFESRRASQTLLRASSLAETSSGALLRPVQGVVQTEEAELLRPGIPRPEGETEAERQDYSLTNGLYTREALLPQPL